MLLIAFADTFQNIDEWLFLFINNGLSNPLFDKIMPLSREATTWLPLYLFLLVFVVMNFGKKTLPFILFVAITITVSDQLSSSVIKYWVARPRPCHNALLMQYAHLLVGCSPSYSFTSSHATNHFAAALFFHTTLKHYLKNWSYLFFLWAAWVSTAQVYVGIHYPFDVIGGGLVGSFIGFGMASIFNRRLGRLML